MSQHAWLQHVAEKLSALSSHAMSEEEEPAVWQSIAQELLTHKHQSETLAEQRPLFEEFLAKFPTAALHWRAYAELAMAVNSPEVRTIFSRSLLNCPSLDLWTTYLNFIKRMNQSKGAEGMLETRQAYEYALDRIGLDVQSGGLWQEYINFLQLPRPNTPAYRTLWAAGSAPGQEDSQRVMTLRGAYQRALQVPSTGLDQLWRAYEVFEQQGTSRALSRRLLEQQRPRYQTSRTALGQRTALLDALDPAALALAPGAGGYQQQQQAMAWRAYLGWECSNPQKLPLPDLLARVALAHEQALMHLRHYPDIWAGYADWHLQGESPNPSRALSILNNARQVLPTCLLLHFAAADIEEAQGNIEAAQQVFQGLLPSLAPAGSQAPAPPQLSPELATCAWVECLRFVRRAQSLKEARQVFVKASRAPDIGWQVFVASALMEWHYDNSSAKVPNNIWEMGAKRFMAQPGFALAYIEYQLGLGDTANARATFERALTVTPLEEAQPLWNGYLKFEVQHGTPEAVRKVQQRRAEAASEPSPSDHLNLLLLKHRNWDLWPVPSDQKQHLQRLLGLLPPLRAPVAPQALPSAPAGPIRALPGPSNSPGMEHWSPAPGAHMSPLRGGPDGPPGGPQGQAPPAAASQRGPPPPLTQFPLELGNFINKLPPERDLQGGHPSVDQVIEILMTADLSEDARMEFDNTGRGGGAGPSRPLQQQGGPQQQQQQNGGAMQQMPGLNGQHMAPGSDMAGLKRKQPDNGFGIGADVQQGDSPTLRNAPPVHDVFRMRRKQRTKMSDA